MVYGFVWSEDPEFRVGCGGDDWPEVDYNTDNVLITAIIPEPSAAALCGLGLTAVAGLKRRRSG